MPRNLSNTFLITSFFDDARWSSETNYNLINYFSDDLTDDDKLLTHWLCYITDRQMEFRRIWDVGGYIVSNIINSVRLSDDLSLLDPRCPDRSFFIQTGDYTYKNEYEATGPLSTDGYLFVGRRNVGKNKKLLEYGFFPDTTPFFLSRYYPSDFKSMLNSFVILKSFDYSIVKFLLQYS